MSNIEEIVPDIDEVEVKVARTELLKAAESAADLLITSSFDHKCYLDFTLKGDDYKVYISVEPIE